MKPLLRFVALFLRHPWMLAAGLLCIPGAVWIDIQISLTVADALNRLETADESFLNRVLLIICSIAILRGLLRFCMRWFVVTSRGGSSVTSSSRSSTS